MSLKRILNWFRRSQNASDDDLRVELQMHYDRIATIERLLDLDGTKAAYALAEQMQLDLFEKRRNPKPLTESEKYTQSRFTKKKDCRHLKGGWMYRFGWDKFCGSFGGWKDYNVSRHTFSDLSTYIKCLTCGKKWLPKDRDWNEAVEMTKQSTNTPSSSEMAFTFDHPYKRPQNA